MPDSFMNEVERVTLRHGFLINGRKTRYSRPGQASYVTGFVVSEKVQPDRKTRRRLRAMFHQAWSHPERFKEKRFELQGWASYARIYNSKLGQRYLDIAQSIASD